MEPAFSVSKQLRWNSILRLGTSALPIVGSSNAPAASDNLYFRRMEVDFSPDFMSASVGDFYEAYTPFTLWNRNNLDLYYKPEMVVRIDDTRKYEGFLNQEPGLAFQGTSRRYGH